MKICRKCNSNLPFSEFHHDKTQSDGFRSRCKSCANSDKRGQYNSETKRTYYLQNRSHKRAYYKQNRKRILENARDWRVANPEACRMHDSQKRLRRSIEMDSVDRILSTEWRKAIRDNPCTYCGAPGEHDDHVIPLARGGTDHWYNLVRACADCNIAKAANDLDCFLEEILPELLAEGVPA